jgi:hypothetical protein
MKSLGEGPSSPPPFGLTVLISCEPIAVPKPMPTIPGRFPETSGSWLTHWT